MKYSTKQIIAWYSVFLGVSVIAIWVNIILNEPIQEGKKEMFFHLFSEAIMAVSCIIGGYLLIVKKNAIILLLAHAMVIYSALNAAGYYFERDNLSMTFIFLILFTISVLCLILLIKFIYNRTPYRIQKPHQ